MNRTLRLLFVLAIGMMPLVGCGGKAPATPEEASQGMDDPASFAAETPDEPGAASPP